MIRRSVCSIAVGLALTALHLAGPSAQAQIGRSRVSGGGPGYWVGLSMAYVEGISLTDDATGASWNFGYASQIRATLEKTLEGGASVGIAAGFSTPPLTYTPASAFNVNCPGQCQAHADVTQYMAYVHTSRAGVGLHGLFDLEGGVTQFSNFREKTTDAKITDTNGRYDPTFGFGAGFGFGVTPTADIYAGEMLDFVLHRQSTAVTSPSAPKLFSFRAGFRIGF